MSKKFYQYLSLILAVLLLISVGMHFIPRDNDPEPVINDPVVEPTPVPGNNGPDNGDQQVKVKEDGQYSSKDEVALYIHLYNHLPDNFLTKSEAKKKGWSSGSLDSVLPGYSIGGDRFQNREGLLPKKDGRVYYECDIDTVGRSQRGEKRIVFSNDGLIYYTDDHYESFELLYGDPE
ncbi:MAG: ribonuclease [Erysipelotrichaceae bacterium]|nr:ribonuclease [Erysipelotrichaceae bacterium]